MAPCPAAPSFSLDIDGEAAQYARLLRHLPAGLNEWAVHPSTGGEESRSIDDGWRVRRTGYAFLTSPEARELLRQEGIVVIDYRSIQQAWSHRFRRTGAAFDEAAPA
ncbi:hypothetical protein ABZ297_38445 [Nonomuraea sp. NPDC005983]|uniref:hypothetical protein n=1 Tax=Nonomuraea sp. NPDC005983 TaxID=3155595 RepID=UPI0033A7620D